MYVLSNSGFRAEALSIILEKFGIEKRENIVFVGDTYNTDVKGANNVGIDVVWINHKGEKNTDDLSLHSISNIGELVGVVKTMLEFKLSD